MVQVFVVICDKEEQDIVVTSGVCVLCDMEQHGLVFRNDSLTGDVCRFCTVRTGIISHQTNVTFALL